MSTSSNTTSLTQENETLKSALTVTRKLLAAYERGEVPPKDATGTHYGQDWLDAAPDFNAPGVGVQQASAQSKCKTCGGVGIVDDGEIDHYPNGEPYMHGPVKCVKDCPDCGAPVPPAQARQQAVALTDNQIDAEAKHFSGLGGIADYRAFARAILAAGGAQ